MKSPTVLISVRTACLMCLVAALMATPATAGVNRWTAIGPDGANVVALVIDPVEPSTAFAGTTGSGILKTTDGGASWATANSGLSTTDVIALAIDPSMPSTLYAGTDAGVFKSTDGGQSWAAANAGFDGAPQVTVNALAVDPGSPTTVYAATSGGLFKTNNGAASWTSINAGLSGLTPRLISIDPASPSTLYVGVDDAAYYVYNGVFKSSDAGMSWTRIYTVQCGFMCDGAPSVAAIATDSRSPSRLYVAVDGGELVRSLDAGMSWSVITPPQSTSSLTIDPESPASLYVGTYSGAVFRSTDAGDHWTVVSVNSLAASRINVIALAASAPATVYAGCDTGIFRSFDGAQTWARLTLGVRNIGAYKLAVDPVDLSTIYAVIKGTIVKTTDAGAHWADANLGLSNASISSLVLDPSSPSTLYAASSTVFKSTDAGAHWAIASDALAPSNFLSAIAIAPSRPSTLFISVDSKGIFKSTDGGSSWTFTNAGLTAVGPYISAVSVDPTNADIVYVATRPTFRPDTDAKIFKSTDGAAHWREVVISLPTGSNITSLAIDTATPSTLYTAYAVFDSPGAGGVFKSSDSGETWTASQNLLPTTWILALAIDPSSPSHIYAGTREGVMRSVNAAASWTPFSAGLPSLQVWDLSIDRSGSLLRASAPSVGLFEYELAEAPPSPGTIPVIEYFYPAFGHYFITSIADEINALDNGAFPGWVRTGLQFNVYAVSRVDTSPVCRYFSTAFTPKSSHFHSAFGFECDAVQANPNWTLETNAAFYIGVPATDGSCAAGFVPVYRLYNNGQGGAPSHRYTTDFAVRAQMIAQGWVPEGLGTDAAGMCSPQ